MLFPVWRFWIHTCSAWWRSDVLHTPPDWVWWKAAPQAELLPPCWRSLEAPLMGSWRRQDPHPLLCSPPSEGNIRTKWNFSGSWWIHQVSRLWRTCVEGLERSACLSFSWSLILLCLGFWFPAWFADWLDVCWGWELGDSLDDWLEADFASLDWDASLNFAA